MGVMQDAPNQAESVLSIPSAAPKRWEWSDGRIARFAGANHWLRNEAGTPVGCRAIDTTTRWSNCTGTACIVCSRSSGT